MKLKTFILTFLLMIMSSPIVFGQSRTVTAEVRSFIELDEAIKSASNDPDLRANILLKRDIEFSKRIMIPDGVTVYIDINGFNLTCTGDYAFQNEGNLTIEDNGNYDSQYGWSVAKLKSTGILNAYNGKGTLTLNNVHVESNGTSGVVINNKVGGIVFIENGEIISTGQANAIQNDGYMEIKDAIVKTEYRIVIGKDSQLKLNNTKIYDPNGAYRYDGKFYTAEEINALNNPNSDPNIPNVVTEENESFFVKAVMGTTAFASLNDAVDFAMGNNGKVVDLLYNDVLTRTAMITNAADNFTINGNGNTVTVDENMPLLTNFPVKIAFSVKAENTTFNNLNVKSDDTHVFYFRGGNDSNMEVATINNCNVEGWGAVYVSQPNAVIYINNSILVGTNVRTDIHANSFGTIALNTMADGVKINMNGGSVTAKSEGNAIQYAIANSETDNSLANSEFIIDADIITEGNNAKYVGFDGDDKSPKAQVRAEYADELFAEGWATSEVEGTNMISVDGIAVAMIDGKTYGSIAEAYMAVTDGQTIEILAEDKTLGTALNYPVNGDDVIATNFTITTKEGFEFTTKAKLIFNNVNVTFLNSDVNAVLNSSINTNIVLSGVNDIKTLQSSNGGIFSVAGGEQTIGTLMGELNVSGEQTLAINAVGTGALLVMNGATLNGTLPANIDVTVAEGENVINAALKGGNLVVAENTTLAVNADMTDLASLAVNGTMNAAANVKVNPAEGGSTVINGTFTIAGEGKEASIYRSVTVNGIVNVNGGAKFTQSNKNYSFNLNDGAAINVAEGSYITVGGAKVAEDATVTLNFNSNASFKSTTNAGTINLYMKEGTKFTTTEITTGLVETTDFGCKIFYENGAYIAKRILNEGDVAIIEGTGVGYATLQAAIDACETGNSTINLLADITEDATVSQAENTAITINGNSKTMKGTITVNGKSARYATAALTIKNVNFNVTDGINYDACIRLGDGTNNTRYTNKVIIESCSFTDDYTEVCSNVVVAVKSYTGGDWNLTIKDCTATGMHSLAQLKNVEKGLEISGCNVEGARGLALGCSQDVKIKNCTIVSKCDDKYGIRIDANASSEITISNTSVEAMIPVVVRNATTNGIINNITFAGENTMTPSNDANMWFVAGKEEYEGGETLPTVGGQVVVNIDEDSNLSYEGVYGHYGVAQIGNQRFQSLEAAAAAAKHNDTIELLWKEGQAPILMRATFVGDKTVTITGKAEVAWEDNDNTTDDWFYVGCNGEGNGHVIFDDAHLTLKSNSSSYGFNVSGSKYGDNNTNNGTIEIKDSNIELDYLINKNVMSLENSTLTVKNGFSVGGRPGHDKDGNQDSETGVDATATMTLTNGSKVFVDNHNGMGLGYEAIGIMNIDTTSSFEATQNFLVTAKGTMNLAGTATIAAGKTLTNNGTINLTNTDAKLYTTTTGLSIKTDLTGYKANYYAATDEEAAHYKLLSNYGFNFVIKDSDGNIVNGYTTFPRAIDAAQDGQTVEIRTNGPIILGSDKTVGVVGKTVTVKAGEGFAPVKYDNNNRDMLVGNGAKVIFDDVEFIPRYELDANTKESGFVVNNGGIVEFVNGADITTDYITVNEGGIININNSNVNVNGTFINNNVVNVEGTSDIYMETSLHENSPLGDGYFHMNGVTMNNSYVKGVKVIFNGENNNIGSSSTFTGSLLDIAEGAEVNVSGNASFTSNISGSVGISKIEGRLNLTSSKSAVFNNLRLAGVIEVGEESNLKIGSTLYKNEGANIILNPQYATVNLQEGHLDIFTSNEWDYKVVYNNGVYSLEPISYNFWIVDAEGNEPYDSDHQFLTFAEALAKVQNDETIVIKDDAKGDEADTEITYEKDIHFTIKGYAQDYILPRITFKNTNVDIIDAKFSSPDIDARDNAEINIKESSIYNNITRNGKNPTVKATSNGIINIDNSVISTCNLFAMGTINITDNTKVYATANTSVYETGKLNIESGAVVHIAALALTGEKYEGTFVGAEPANPFDNTSAKLTVDNATFVVGNIQNIQGADYSYHVEKYGINIGTKEQEAILDIKNNAIVEFYMAPSTNSKCKNPVIGANGTVNIDGSSFVVKHRNVSTEVLALQNNGVVNVTGESDIDATVQGDGWFYMNGVTMSDETKLLGAKVRFASGTNSLVGSTIDDGYFQVGIGLYKGTDENVDTENGVIVNVSENATVGAKGATYAGWIGSGYYENDVDKAAAMTNAKYVLNINNSIAQFGYLHVSNDGIMYVNGKATTQASYNTSKYSFYAGDFIINGEAKFYKTDVLALYTKVSCDNGTEKPGTLIIEDTEYEAEHHNGAIDSINFRLYKTGVVNTNATLLLDEYTSIAEDAKFNVLGGNVTALGTITNNGTINVSGGTMTIGTLNIDGITNTGTLTIGQGTQMTAIGNIGNSGTMTIDGTLTADAQFNTTGIVTVNGTLNRTGSVANQINVNSGTMDVNGNVLANMINNNADFNVLKGGNVDVTDFQINANVDVTTPSKFFVGNDVSGNSTFLMENVALTDTSQLRAAKIQFTGKNSLYNTVLNGSAVTVNSGATLNISQGSSYIPNTIYVASLTNSGTFTVGNYANVNVVTSVTNHDTFTVEGELTAASLTNNGKFTVNGNLDANNGTLTNNGTIEGNGIISANDVVNNKSIDVNKITSTDFNNNSTVKVDNAHLESVNFSNAGTVNVSGVNSIVKITNPVTGIGKFNMEGVELNNNNTTLSGANIVFNGENNRAYGGVTFGSNTEVNGNLYIDGHVKAEGNVSGSGQIILTKSIDSKFEAVAGLAIYPTDPEFVTSGVQGYHVVYEGSAYILHNFDDYVAQIEESGIYYETIQEAVDAAIAGQTVIIMKDVVEDVEVRNNIKFSSEAPINVDGTLTVYANATFLKEITFTTVKIAEESTINVEKALTANRLEMRGTNGRLFINNDATVTVNTTPIINLTPRVVLNSRYATFVTNSLTDEKVIAGELLDPDYKVSYKNGKYQLVSQYVAQTVEARYETLEAALAAVKDGETIELLWEDNDDPIVMAGILSGKNATIKQAEATDAIVVDWSKGWLFIARGAEYNNGPATLTFEGVNLTSVNDGVGTDGNRYGINVSAKRKNTENYNGELVIKDSNVELSYLYNAYKATFDHSTVTLIHETGMNVGGLLGSYTTTGYAGTAELFVNNGTTFNVTNITLGYDGIGIMNVDETSVVNSKSPYHINIIEGGYINTYGDFFYGGESGIGYNYFNIEADGQVNVFAGLYSFDVNPYCVEGVAAFELPTGNWEVRETSGTQTRKLADAGWYWFSSYISDLEGTTGLQLLQSELNPNGKQIKGQFAFTNYFGSKWSTGGLQSVTTAQMYMLNTTAPVTLEFEGKFVDYSNTPIVLNPGWNWIGFPVRYAQTVEVALANLQPKHGDIIKGKNGSSTYYVTDSFEGWFPELILEPGHGHMYYSTSDETVTFVFNSNGQPAESKRATAAMYWNVNETAYPSNMTMIATTDIEGGDYEVAAFVNGEVRGSARPIYVEALDAYVLVLTIQGNDVEEMTFRYYDITTGEEMSFSNRINYTNDAIIGSMAEPYKLTRGTTGIGEVALSDVNIYPNPTTTGVQVNLDATCEKVEIFNALGVKVAEYQNVDSIDAFETAGIYVIRLTNGGEIKHTRLVVR